MTGPTAATASLAVAELLVRHELGHYRHRPVVHDRLAEILRTDPPDALARLERAAEHLGVTGDQAHELVTQAVTNTSTCEPAPDSTSQPVNVRAFETLSTQRRPSE